MRRDTKRRWLLGWLALAVAGALSGSGPAAATGSDAPATTLADLVERLAAMPGFQARFEEEKSIALLAVPLASSGRIYFVPPHLLLRRVERPEPSLLRLDEDELVFTDAGGSERLDLQANPAARAFARTFTDILAGDLPRLRQSYEIGFRAEQPGAGGWRLELRPRSPGLARAINSVEVSGRGLVLRELVVREASGDVSVTRFRDVDTERHFESAEIDRLQGLPAP